MAANQTNGAKTTTSRSTRKADSSSRGKTTSKSTTKAKSSRAISGRPEGRIRNGSFPPSINEFTTRLRKRLKDLDREIERIEGRFMRVVERLRSAGSPIGIDVERNWRALADPIRRDISNLLRRIEKVIEPPLISKRRPRAKASKTIRTPKARAA